MSGQTTQTGIPVRHCNQCGVGHPITRRHCVDCGGASLFIKPDGQCIHCEKRATSD